MIETAQRRPHNWISLSHLVMAVSWVALVIAAWVPIRDNSFLWHVRSGSLQIEMGRVLTEDPFSFTLLGTPWLTQSWLIELAYGWGEGMVGLGFVPPMVLFMGVVTVGGVGLIAYKRARNTAAAAVVMLLSSVLLVSFLVPRPVIVSYALFVLVVLSWERSSTRWTLPFLFWVWAAIHGSFIIGLGYIGLLIIKRRDWSSLPVAVASGVVTLATAHGLGVISMLVAFAGATDTLALLSEWRRPELLSAVFLPFLIGLGLIVFALSRGTLAARHLWIIVPFAALGFSSTRAVPPAWLGLVPIVALTMRGMKLGTTGRFSAGPALLFGIVVFSLPLLVKGDGRLDPQRFPIEAVGSLSDANTFHDDVTGGYLIWSAGPDRLVFLDDRAELYGERILEYVNVRSGEVGWEVVFARDNIGQALLRSDEKLAMDLSDAGWLEVYDDGEFVVLRP